MINLNIKHINNINENTNKDYIFLLIILDKNICSISNYAGKAVGETGTLTYSK